MEIVIYPELHDGFDYFVKTNIKQLPPYLSCYYDSRLLCFIGGSILIRPIECDWWIEITHNDLLERIK